MDHRHWMRRCVQLALRASGHTAPNPLVGCVLVQGDTELAHGWHARAGAPHAEAACLAQWGTAPVPADAVLYVSLEPCAHHGRTPPCSELLIARGVRTVVVGCGDPDPRTAGAGIAKLRAAGITVIEKVNEAECRWANRRFLSAFEQKRPWTILKWARSADGFLDRWPRDARQVQRISSPETDRMVHAWRAEEEAILVGARTVINDDPRLDVRHVEGRSPLRVVIDRQGRTPAASRVFDGSHPTLLVTAVERKDIAVKQILIAPDADPIDAVHAALQARAIRSLLVEGGAELLGHFLHSDRWDEARVIQGQPSFGKGTAAPTIDKPVQRSIHSGSDTIAFYTRHTAVDPAWHW